MRFRHTLILRRASRLAAPLLSPTFFLYAYTPQTARQATGIWLYTRWIFTSTRRGWARSRSRLSRRPVYPPSPAWCTPRVDTSASSGGCVYASPLQMGSARCPDPWIMMMSRLIMCITVKKLTRTKKKLGALLMAGLLLCRRPDRPPWSRRGSGDQHQPSAAIYSVCRAE